MIKNYGVVQVETAVYARNNEVAANKHPKIMYTSFNKEGKLQTATLLSCGNDQ